MMGDILFTGMMGDILRVIVWMNSSYASSSEARAEDQSRKPAALAPLPGVDRVPS
jgi:hypothetical protein